MDRLFSFFKNFLKMCRRRHPMGWRKDENHWSYRSGDKQAFCYMADKTPLMFFDVSVASWKMYWVKIIWTQMLSSLGWIWTCHLRLEFATRKSDMVMRLKVFAGVDCPFDFNRRDIRIVVVPEFYLYSCGSSWLLQCNIWPRIWECTFSFSS